MKRILPSSSIKIFFLFLGNFDWNFDAGSLFLLLFPLLTLFFQLFDLPGFKHEITTSRGALI